MMMHRTVPLAAGALLLILALFKVLTFWRLSTGFRGLGLIRVLVTDQISYYLL